MPTMTEYDFTQQIDYPNILIENIQQSSISVPIVNVETNGSGPTMEVSLFFQDVLSSNDQATLNSIMSSYVNSLPPMQVALNQVNKNIAFGMSMIAQFSASNVAANLTTDQVATLAQQLGSIQTLLLSGSIATALTLVQAVTPTDLISQDTINLYTGLLQNYVNNQPSN